MAQRDDPCPAADPLVGGEQRGPHGAVRPGGIGSWLLWVTLGGSCVVSGRRTGPGEAVLIAPRTPHDYGPPPGALWHVRWAVFAAPAAWRGLLDWEGREDGIAIAPAPLASSERLDQAWRLAAAGRTALAMNALEASLLWLREPRRAKSGLDPRVAEVVGRIAADPAAPVDLPSAARRAGLSVPQFARLFRQGQGASFQRWLEDLRLARGRELLRTTSLPVAVVAGLCGFADPFYFSARMRRLSGRPPSAWR